MTRPERNEVGTKGQCAVPWARLVSSLVLTESIWSNDGAACEWWRKKEPAKEERVAVEKMRVNCLRIHSARP